MASKPQKRQVNLLAALMILLLMVVIGNQIGKKMGLEGISTSKSKGRPREYRYFGLQKYWAAEQQPSKLEQHWWKFWT